MREMWLGHDIKLAGSYYKPTVEDMRLEYSKAINLLTINEENRLKKKVTELESKQTEIDLMRLKYETEMKAMNQQMDKMESMISNVFSKVSGNLNQLTGIDSIDKKRMKQYGFNPSRQ